MKYLIYIFFFLSASELFSQEVKNIYLDQNLQVISETTYKNKFQKKLYYVTQINTDSVVYKKLKYKLVYDRLEANVKSQLNKLLYRDYAIDSTKIWFIHYIDTMPNIEKFSKSNRSDIELKTSPSGMNYKSITHNHTFREEVKYFHKEVDYISKFENTSVLHFYSENTNYPKDIDIYKILKDPLNLLRKIFSDGIAPYRNIIVYPNGDFVMSTFNLSHEQIKTHLNQKKFKKNKKIWQLKIEE